MSLLQAIRAKKKERLTIKHLLHKEDISIRYAYCVGNAILAMLDGEMSPSEINTIEDLAYSLELSEEETKNIIEEGKRQDPAMIDTILESVSEKEHQYLFLLDLYKIANIDGNLTDEKQELIEALADMMYFSEEEKNFIKNYSKAVYEKDQTKAREVLNYTYDKNIEPPFHVLKFFMPDLDYKEEIEGFTLENGAVRQLTRPCIIKGPVVVNSGTRLIIKGISVMFNGNDAHIHVNGGQLDLSDSELIAGEECGDRMVRVNNLPSVDIKNTIFDGNRKKGALFMESGNLEITDCTFKSLFSNKYGGAIYLNQVKASISNSCFEDCVALLDGGGIYKYNGNLRIYNYCKFKNCEAKGNGGGIGSHNAVLVIKNSKFLNCLGGNGGGINQSTVFESSIKSCYFEKCVSTNSGGAVYKGNNYTSVEDCSYENCKPNNVS